MNRRITPTRITRETLEDWRIATMARELDGSEATVASEDHLLQSRRNIVPDNADCEDLWVFGYGSLISNPIIAHNQRLTARIHGYHRRFCLWTKIGRGSPEFPGLVLSLDHGGSCVGIAYQLEPETAIAELDLLWRRECSPSPTMRAGCICTRPRESNVGSVLLPTQEVQPMRHPCHSKIPSTLWQGRLALMGVAMNTCLIHSLE